MRFFAIVFAFVVGLSLLIVPQYITSTEKVVFPKNHFFDTATIKVGQTTLQVQVADTLERKKRGLMNRKTIAPYDGMLFVFEYPQQAMFWMKDTYIPLDVGFFDPQGKLIEIHSLKPLDTTPIRSFSSNVLYALELPEGDFHKKNIKINNILTYQKSAKASDSRESVLD